MNTYTYEPLIGISSHCDANNRITQYEYDAFQRLSLIKDQNDNILKKYCYNYFGQPEDCGINKAPQWQATGRTRCKPCTQNSAYATNILQHEENDANTASATYNQKRWIEDGLSNTCVVYPDWQVVSTSCEQNSSVNTGNLITTEQDVNPCSGTYNQTRQSTVQNATACPLPCTTTNCIGPEYKCVNGVCERGQKVYLSSSRISKTSPWTCVYVYCFSDGFQSAQYSQTSSTSCFISSCLAF